MNPGSAEHNNRMVNLFELAKGDVLRVQVWHNAKNTLSGGGANWGSAATRWNIALMQAASVNESGVPPDPTNIQGA